MAALVGMDRRMYGQGLPQARNQALLAESMRHMQSMLQQGPGPATSARSPVRQTTKQWSLQGLRSGAWGERGDPVRHRSSRDLGSRAKPQGRVPSPPFQQHSSQARSLVPPQRHVSPQPSRHVSPQPHRTLSHQPTASQPSHRRPATAPLDPLLGKAFSAAAPLRGQDAVNGSLAVRVKELATPQRGLGALSPQSHLIKQTKPVGVEVFPPSSKGPADREPPKRQARPDASKRFEPVLTAQKGQVERGGDAAAYSFPRLLGSTMSLSSVAEAPEPAHKLQHSSTRLAQAPANNPFKLPSSPEKPDQQLYSIDGLTQVPERLFEDLLRAGKETRSRGQHVLMPRSRTNERSRLIHREVLQRMGAQRRAEEQQRRCMASQESTRRILPDYGLTDVRLPLAAAC